MVHTQLPSPALTFNLVVDALFLFFFYLAFLSKLQLQHPLPHLPFCHTHTHAVVVIGVRPDFTVNDTVSWLPGNEAPKCGSIFRKVVRKACSATFAKLNLLIMEAQRLCMSI